MRTLALFGLDADCLPRLAVRGRERWYAENADAYDAADRKYPTAREMAELFERSRALPAPEARRAA